MELKSDDRRDELSHEELLSFVGGEASAETKRRIAAEMKIEGSKVRKWFQRLSKIAEDPTRIRWGKLASEGEPEEGDGPDDKETHASEGEPEHS